MNSENQQGGQYGQNFSLGRDPIQLPVDEDRDVNDEYAAESNSSLTTSEVGPHIDNYASGLVRSYNHEEGMSEQFKFLDRAFPMKNPDENDNKPECVPIEGRPEFLKTTNEQAIVNDIQKGLHLEADNSSGWFNRSQEEASPLSGISSLGTKVVPGKRKKSKTKTESLVCQQTKEEQSGTQAAAVRKSDRQRSQTVKFDQSDEARGTPRKSRRKMVSTSGDGESEPSEEEVFELRQLLVLVNPMPNELWQWATPAIYALENESKFYKRCFTGTQQAPILSFKLGDAVQLMAPDTSKYIGIVAELFQRHRREQDRDQYRYLDERVHTVWLYPKEELPKDAIAEVCENLREKGLNPKAALFISQHSDENPLQMVLRPIKLVSVEEYSSDTSRHDSNEYYLAGVYDSFNGKVHLELRVDFSLPKLLRYDSLKQQALRGKRVLMPRTLSANWFSND